MKKIIIICSAFLALAAVLAVSAVVYGEFFFGPKLPSVSNSATIAQVADYYADVVELTKNEKNMKIETVTEISFKEFNCPNKNLGKLILDYLGYEVGAREKKTVSYSFSDGTDKAGVTPFNVIQPAGASIEKGNYAGLSQSFVEKDKEHTEVSFYITKESADYAEIVAVFKTEDGDFSVLAPRHFDYIDVKGIVLYLKDMLNIDVSSDEVKNSISEIESAQISLGDTEIKATVNSDALLTEVTVTAPVVFDGQVRLVNSINRITARLEVSQRYVFTYTEEN